LIILISGRFSLNPPFLLRRYILLPIAVFIRNVTPLTVIEEFLYYDEPQMTVQAVLSGQVRSPLTGFHYDASRRVEISQHSVTCWSSGSHAEALSVHV
jgi:hypothetical protein